METEQLQSLFIELIGLELNQTEPCDNIKAKLTSDVISALFTLSKRHDMAHIVSAALNRCGVLGDDEVSKAFKKQEIMSVYRNTQLEHEQAQIFSLLNNAKVPYIPLKGAVIRSFYPKENMRTSCDIDILVNESDVETAIKSLTDAGYKLGERDYHDVSLYSVSNIHLELHFSLLEHMENIDLVLASVWDFAKKAEEYRYSLSDEFFVFYTFAHMYYHFLSGGCGVKSLMDLFIIENKMGISIDIAKELLQKAEIYTFAKKLIKLSRVCFGCEKPNKLSELLLGYIVIGGAYGNRLNEIAIKRAGSGGTSKYILTRVFMPYKSMTADYPILLKLPILLPFCWVIRLVKSVFGGKIKKAAIEADAAKNFSQTKLDDMKYICEEMEIKGILKQ